MWYHFLRGSGWGICIGDMANLGSDEINRCPYFWSSSRDHPLYYCPDELGAATSSIWNLEINCVLEDWKIALIATGLSLVVVIVLGIYLIYCKISRTKYQRRMAMMATTNQNVATTTSSNLQNAPSAPSYFDLNYSPTSNSITTNNKSNDPVNSEDNPPTYEEFLQSNR